MSRGYLVKKELEKNSSSLLTNSGALSVFSGDHTGRSPRAKFIVYDDLTQDTVDWSSNQMISKEEWKDIWSHAQSFITVNSDYGKDFYEIIASAGKSTKWETRTKKTFKFVCENPVQKIFISNMFEQEVGAKKKELEGEVLCLPSLTKDPRVILNFSEKRIVISGTKYLGEIKKSVFTYMNYILTDAKILPMHCSVNTDIDGKSPAIFFGLSGTGKTTLSASPNRMLLGDDEHGWVDGVLFNIESGCYAKTIGLTKESEPEIFSAVQNFGSILENVRVKDGQPDFEDVTLTQNGRASYPISHIENHISDGFVELNPKNVIMLTCDATGVLPAVSKLSIDQAKKMFLVGYTSKVAGTEVGVAEPQAVFSPCFGAPFLPRHPNVYANMLSELVKKTGATCWLVNTGWVGGPPGVGKRIDLKSTRKIVDQILNDKLIQSEFEYHEHTGLTIPTKFFEIKRLSPRPEDAWNSIEDYKESAQDLVSKIDEKISLTL